MIGQTIAGYEVLDEIGVGGMGVVYKARHLRLGRYVALKRLPPQQLGNDRRRRFLHEARAASALNHPGIVTIHDVIRHDNDDIIVMELVEGKPLTQVIPATGLPWKEAVDLALQLCQAMAAAHTAGIVHRDLKPANVMVISGTHGRRLKVLDFGIAKRLSVGHQTPQDLPPPPSPQMPGAEPLPGDLTQVGVQPGTPSYMAPEQVLGEAIDRRSDIFSFGMLLYEMLIARRPFHTADSVAMVDHLLHDDPPSIRALEPEVPLALEALVFKALAKQPVHRHQSMDEIAQALLSFAPANHLAEASEPSVGITLKTLVAADWTEATSLEDLLSDEAAPSQDVETLVQDLVDGHRGAEVVCQEGYRLLLFELPREAVRFALAWHRELVRWSKLNRTQVETRVGVHVGEVTVSRSLAPPDPSPEHNTDRDGDINRSDPSAALSFEVDTSAQRTARRLMTLADCHQTLLTGAAFDLARRSAPHGATGNENLHWLAHGDYLFSDDQVIEIFEVGARDFAPLRPPAGSSRVRRAPSQGKILGWRPAPGLPIPQRSDWEIERKLGEGGFGEVWLANHSRTHEHRVFKFCYEAEQLRSLQHEINLFRLLKEELGERPDIARLIAWNLEQAPYFIESAFTEGGSLVDWSKGCGGLDTVELDDRLELMAQVATALEAAHSVGVLHKDVKPANVLITEPPVGNPQAILTDFGIGQILDPKQLEDRGITVLGSSAASIPNDGSTQSGTGLYMAPELLTGRPPSIQSDLYAFGVMLFQVAVGDLGRPVAGGWERDINDELLRQDIADCLDGLPSNRPRSALEVAQRLRGLESRHNVLQAERRALREAEVAEQQAQQKARRSARRRRWLTATTIASALFLVVVSFLAWQAVQARAEAERGRSQAEQLIDVLMGDLHESLEKIGRLDLLELAARGSQDYFDALDARHEARAITVKRGVTLLNIGDVLLLQGDTDAASDAYQGARELLSTTASDSPESFEILDAKRRSQVKMAWALSRQGNTLGALETVQTALEETARRAAAHADDPRWKFGLAECQYSICYFEDKVGHRPQALDACRLALDYLDSPAAPEDQPWRHSLLALNSHIMIAGTLRILKQGEAAAEEYGRARELATHLMQHDPANTNWSEKLAWIHFQSGILQFFHRGDSSAARVDLNAARLAYEKMSQLDPTQTRWRNNLAETLNLIGRVDLQQRDHRSAISRFEQAARILDDLVAQDPSHRSRLGTLARIHQSMGRAHMQVEAIEVAVGSFAAAVDLNARLAEMAGDAPDPQNFLSWSHVVLGDGYARLGNGQRARREWQRAVEIITPVTSTSDAIEYRDTHVQALLKLGRLDEARPMVESLVRDGWQDSMFVDAVRQAGLDDVLP